MSFLLGLKAKLLGLGAILLAVLGFFVRLKYVTGQRDKFKKEAASAKAEVLVQKQVNELDNDIQDELGSRRIEALKEIKRGNRPKNISDPNKF